MCMKATDEACVLKTQLEEVKATTANLDSRLTKVEEDVGKMRAESQSGFKAINDSITNLAHDFGSRMNNLDKRLVEEKVKWGHTLRKMLLLAERVILAGCGIAMGITAWKTLMGGGS